MLVGVDKVESLFLVRLRIGEKAESETNYSFQGTEGLNGRLSSWCEGHASQAKIWVQYAKFEPEEEEEEEEEESLRLVLIVVLGYQN